MLQKIRVFLAIAVFTTLTAFFLDFSETVPRYVAWLAKIQFMPALSAMLSGIIVSLVIVAFLVILTLVFGRVYCSCLCPLGILQDLIAYLKVLFTRQKRKTYHFTKPHTRVRYSFLIAFFCAFILTSLGFVRLSVFIGSLDPYSFFGRIITHIFYPFYALGNNLIALIARHFDNFNFYLVTAGVKSYFILAVSVASFAVLVVMASLHGRLYCNSVCPVGTILGLLSAHSLFRVRLNREKCIRCRLCETACKGTCIDIEHNTIDHSRCVACFNCLKSCKMNAVQYRCVSNNDGNERELTNEINRNDETAVTDLSKRHFLKGAAGLFLTESIFPVLNEVSAQGHISRDSTVKTSELPISKNGKVSYKIVHAISPPGAVSADHLASHCTSCHLCVSKCPQHVIKPAFLDYGMGGIMLPVMKFSTEVFCNYDCTICGEVCPAGAIKLLNLEEKHKTQIGHVVFIKENCVVFTDETNCGACAEHCPTQAVRMIDYKNNLTIPETREQYCVGCGACESICPVEPFKAIHVEGNSVHKQADLPPQEQKVEIEIDDFGF